MTKKKTKRTICLGIESTAHTFGIGIVDEQGKILANVKDMYSSEKGGLIPVELAKHHARVCNDILANSIKEAGIENAAGYRQRQPPGGGGRARAVGIPHGPRPQRDSDTAGRVERAGGRTRPGAAHCRDLRHRQSQSIGGGPAGGRRSWGHRHSLFGHR